MFQIVPAPFWLLVRAVPVVPVALALAALLDGVKSAAELSALS